MWNTRLFFFLLLMAGISFGQAADAGPLTAEAIMARVAANQHKASDRRKHDIYKQHIHIVTRKPNARLMREETTDYHVVPTADGTKKELQAIKGRYLHQKQYLDFNGEPEPDSGSLD